jgi:hypothetical protein
MSVFRRYVALLLVAMLAFAPALAEARAGASSSGSGASSYSSMGSRGSSTYSPYSGAAPITRSMTPTSPSSTYGQSTYGQSTYGSGYGAYPRSGFWSGLTGGLFGAWIGSMLFGHSAYGYGYDGGPMHAGGLFGTLIMLLILFWIGRMVWRAIGGAPFAPAFFAGGARPPMGGVPPVARMAQAPINLGDNDLGAFGQILTDVQAAWSRQDLEGLRRVVTPEMLSYFSEQMANNASNGVANRVENVTLLQGDPREAWREGPTEYATAFLRWSAIDYTHRLDRRPADPGFLVEGDPRQPSQAQEFWTFRRVMGGRWQLSAIQQTT